MKRLLAFFLIFIMLCTLFGCGSNQDTATSTTRDQMLYHSLELAKLMGNAIVEDFPQKCGLSEEIAALADVFTIAADPSQVTAAAILRTDNMNPGAAIATANSKLGASASACTGILTFSSAFQLSEKLFGYAGVYLQFGEDCHVIVNFVSVKDGLVTATVYPLFQKAAKMLIQEYFPNMALLSKAEVDAGYSSGGSRSVAAKPNGASTINTYYTNMALQVMDSAKLPNKEVIAQQTANHAFAERAHYMSKYLAAAPLTVAAYNFPDTLDAEIPAFPSDDVKALYRQQMYLSWANRICAIKGEDSAAISAILNATVSIDPAGAAAAQDEVPMIVAMDFRMVTVLITFYPNAHNTYLTSFTYLPYAYSEVCEILARMGASAM